MDWKQKLCSNHELTKDTPYLALMGEGELGGVFPEFFGEKISRVNCVILTFGSPMRSSIMIYEKANDQGPHY